MQQEHWLVDEWQELQDGGWGTGCLRKLVSVWGLEGWARIRSDGSDTKEAKLDFESKV